MKTLFAVKSSMKHWMDGSHKEIRNTWGQCLPENADLRFFFGNGAGWVIPDQDEIHVDAPDDYKGLSLKVKEILKWSIEQGYDYTYLCDTDTFCIPNRVQAILTHALPSDYIGWITPWEPFFAFGGCGFVVSKKFAQIIANSPVQDPLDDISIGKLSHSTEDLVVLNAVKGWLHGVGWHFPKNTYACGVYDSRFPWMKMMAQQYLGVPKMNYTWAVMRGYDIQSVSIQLCTEDRKDEFDELNLQAILPYQGFVRVGEKK